MSYEFDERYDVYDERYPVARKEHRCEACRERILRGDRYTRVGVVFDGIAYEIVRCLRCQAIHRHLRTLGTCDQWPDERLDCGEEYADHWGSEPPPEIAALAFATREEMQLKDGGT